ncbi:MAG: type VI secretion system-associated protein TagF [Paracoccaceae bacterium]
MGTFVYGKHPAFGDFIGAGLPLVVQERLEAWLNAMLADLRAGWAAAWETSFDAAPALFFWVGGRVTGEAALCGVMIPSRDKVGRRFPLLAGTVGNGYLPPVLNAGMTLPADTLAQLDGLEPNAAAGAAGILAALKVEEAEDQPTEPAFWASRADPDAAQLWADVAAADHLRAAATRSYWWLGSGEDAALYATEGWPHARAIAWLMAGGQATAEETEPMAEAG